MIRVTMPTASARRVQTLRARDLSAGDLGDAYLPLKVLAQYSGLSVRTLRSHLQHPVSPLPHYRIGGKILVRRSDFDEWAAPFKAAASTEKSKVSDIVDDILLGLR